MSWFGVPKHIGRVSLEPVECGRFHEYGMKIVAARLLWNALMAGVVFLPMFLIAGAVEIVLRVGEFDGSCTYHLSTAVGVYIGMVVPVILASGVYTVVSIFLPARWIENRPRLTAVVLSPLVPVTIVILDLSGAHLLLVFFSTFIATLAYGICAKIGAVS